MLFFAILLHYYVLYFGAVAVDSAKCMFVLGGLVTGTSTFIRSSSHIQALSRSISVGTFVCHVAVNLKYD